MIRLCESKWSAMLQLCEGKYANGVPCNARVRRTNVSTLRVDRTSHSTPTPTTTAQRNNPLTQLPVLTVVAPFLTSLGTFPAPRLQNQTLTNALVRSIAYQPPPAPLNAAPKLFAPGARTPHPALFVAPESQLLPVLELLLNVDERVSVLVRGQARRSAMPLQARGLGRSRGRVEKQAHSPALRPRRRHGTPC